MSNRVSHLCSLYTGLVFDRLILKHSIDSGFIVSIEPCGDHVLVLLEYMDEIRGVNLNHDLTFKKIEDELIDLVDGFIVELIELDQIMTYEQGGGL